MSMISIKLGRQMLAVDRGVMMAGPLGGSVVVDTSRSPSPLLRQHSHVILSETGYTEEEIDSMLSAGVCRDHARSGS